MDPLTLPLFSPPWTLPPPGTPLTPWDDPWAPFREADPALHRLAVLRFYRTGAALPDSEIDRLLQEAGCAHTGCRRLLAQEGCPAADLPPRRGICPVGLQLTLWRFLARLPVAPAGFGTPGAWALGWPLPWDEVARTWLVRAQEASAGGRLLPPIVGTWLGGILAVRLPGGPGWWLVLVGPVRPDGTLWRVDALRPLAGEAAPEARQVERRAEALVGLRLRAGGRPPDTGYLSGRDELLEALRLTADLLRRRGLRLTEANLAAYLSQARPDLPRTDTRQLRRWLRRYNLDWETVRRLLS